MPWSSWQNKCHFIAKISSDTELVANQKITLFERVDTPVWLHEKIFFNQEVYEFDEIRAYLREGIISSNINGKKIHIEITVLEIFRHQQRVLF